jgi:hypothetical protein
VSNVEGIKDGAERSVTDAEGGDGLISGEDEISEAVGVDDEQIKPLKIEFLGGDDISGFEDGE